MQGPSPVCCSGIESGGGTCGGGFTVSTGPDRKRCGPCPPSLAQPQGSCRDPGTSTFSGLLLATFLPQLMPPPTCPLHWVGPAQGGHFPLLPKPPSAISFHVILGSGKSKRPPGNVSPSSVESHGREAEGAPPRSFKCLAATEHWSVRTAAQLSQGPVLR